MEPTLYCKMLKGSMLFTHVASAGIWMSASCSTSTALEMNCFTWRMEWFLFSIKMKGALHVACQEGRLDIIKFLFESKADINKQTEKILSTPLHSAIYKNQFAACKLILGFEQGASDQNLERGTEIAKDLKSPEIQVLL
jgi:hypothetical protein